MAYLTYAEYLNYMGTTDLDETTFNNLEYQAEIEIDYYTFNRLQNDSIIPERVKRCVCTLIKLLKDKSIAYAIPNDTGETSNTLQAGITSQSNDGVSISYNVLSASEIVERSKEEIKACILKALSGVKNESGKLITWRGIYPDE